jgi:hypothetical protein
VRGVFLLSITVPFARALQRPYPIYGKAQPGTSADCPTLCRFESILWRSTYRLEIRIAGAVEPDGAVPIIATQKSVK